MFYFTFTNILRQKTLFEKVRALHDKADIISVRLYDVWSLNQYSSNIPGFSSIIFVSQDWFLDTLDLNSIFLQGVHTCNSMQIDMYWFGSL